MLRGTSKSQFDAKKAAEIAECVANHLMDLIKRWPNGQQLRQRKKPANTGARHQFPVLDVNLIDDAAQKTFVDYFERAGEKYDPHKGSLKNYVASIMRNNLRAAIRKSLREKTLSDEFQVSTGHDPISQSMEITESNKFVHEAIAKLPPRYRIAICKEYGIEGALSAEEGPVEPRNALVLFRAKRKLRKLLSKRFKEIDDLFPSDSVSNVWNGIIRCERRSQRHSWRSSS